MKIRAIALIGVSFIILSCATKKSYPSAEVIFLSKKSENVISIQSTGYGNNDINAIKNAEARAFEIILFMGLPNSEYRDPLIANEQMARQSYMQYFNNFFDKEGYRYFIISSKSTKFKIEKDKQSKFKKQQSIISINISSLRKDLEKNGIIRKFGY